MIEDIWTFLWNIYSLPLSLIFVFNGMERDGSGREKNYILENCTLITSKHFNWTPRYKNPDGPCSVQASGDCSMLPCVRCIILFLATGVQRNLSQDTTDWWNLFLLSLGDSGSFQRMTGGCGTSIPPFLWTGFLTSPVSLSGMTQGISSSVEAEQIVWPSARTNQFRKYAASGSGPWSTAAQDLATKMGKKLCVNTHSVPNFHL